MHTIHLAACFCQMNILLFFIGIVAPQTNRRTRVNYFRLFKFECRYWLSMFSELCLLQVLQARSAGDFLVNSHTYEFEQGICMYVCLNLHTNSFEGVAVNCLL